MLSSMNYKKWMQWEADKSASLPSTITAGSPTGAACHGERPFLRLIQCGTQAARCWTSWFKSRKLIPASTTRSRLRVPWQMVQEPKADPCVEHRRRPATGAGGRASNAARKLLDAGHLEHIETNKETDPAYKKGSRPKTYITTS